MYDLASGEHKAAEDFLKLHVGFGQRRINELQNDPELGMSSTGPHYGRWIRAQQSVILVSTSLSADELVAKFVSFLTGRFGDFTQSNQVLAIDISGADHCAYADGDVVQWLAHYAAATRAG